MNPFKFRPADAARVAPGEPHPDEWADNWLSNALAWLSLKLVKSWCSTEDHWTSRVTEYLYTDCPCCLLFRGAILGLVTGMLFAYIANIVL